jgi:hypothetical protein
MLFTDATDKKVLKEQAQSAQMPKMGARRHGGALYGSVRLV